MYTFIYIYMYTRVLPVHRHARFRSKENMVNTSVAQLKDRPPTQGKEQGSFMIMFRAEASLRSACESDQHICLSCSRPQCNVFLFSVTLCSSVYSSHCSVFLFRVTLCSSAYSSHCGVFLSSVTLFSSMYRFSGCSVFLLSVTLFSSV